MPPRRHPRRSSSSNPAHRAGTPPCSQPREGTPYIVTLDAETGKQARGSTRPGHHTRASGCIGGGACGTSGTKRTVHSSSTL